MSGSHVLTIVSVKLMRQIVHMYVMMCGVTISSVVYTVKVHVRLAIVVWPGLDLVIIYNFISLSAKDITHGHWSSAVLSMVNIIF